LWRPKLALTGEEAAKAERDQLFGRRRSVPWSIVLGATGYLLAGLFVMFWVFDVGYGPFDAKRMGTVGEWVSGVATTAGLALSLFLLMRERHEREVERRAAARRAYMDREFGHITTEVDLANEAKALIPIVGSWERIDRPSPDETADLAAKGRYRINFQIYNGLDRPLAHLAARLSLNGDWTATDYDSGRPWPGRLALVEPRILAPGESCVFEMEPTEYFEISVERMTAGAYLSAEWKVGEVNYSWSMHSPESVYLMARLPDRRKSKA
jgi:hypothetical protein